MLLFKSVSFLFIGLPVLLIMLGALFRATNPIGLLWAYVAAIVFTAVGQAFAHHFEFSSLSTLLLAMCQLVLVFWITPWAGFFVSVSMADGDFKNSPVGKSAQRVRQTYNDMDPASKARFNQFAEDMFRAACKAGAGHLAKRKLNVEDVIDKTSKRR
jgi:hypothetical protein